MQHRNTRIRFNSKLVRLKAASKINMQFLNDSFNSKLVRLKGGISAR